MAFEKMTNREQVLVLIVVATFVGGAYGLLRYVPETKTLKTMSKALEQNKLDIKTPKFPDAPEEDVEDLEDKELEITEKLAAMQIVLDSETKKLAPIDQSQDVMLKISEAARAANVKVSDSVPYVVQRVNVPKIEDPSTKLTKNAQKKRDRKLRKQGGAGALTLGAASGAPPKEGELIYQLVNSFEEQRPLQRLNVEGGFKDIQSFIYALSNMPFQVTIVKLDIDLKFQTPAQGIPQPLLAKMIIAI